MLRARAEPAAAPSGTPAGRVDADGGVATGDGCLRLVEVQPEGKPAMAAAAWLAGRQGVSTRLES